MKRTAAAGTFALLAGGATLLLLASVFYSCRGGGQPHKMGNENETDGSSHSSSVVQSSPNVARNIAPDPARRVTLSANDAV